MEFPEIIDLHMHTTVSDGTDSPEEILKRVQDAGIELFSVTDHDALKGSAQIKELLLKEDPHKRPAFITGVEFSCRDKMGKYHILGYGYDETSEDILQLIKKAHAIRVQKTAERIDYIEKEFGFSFAEEDVEKIFQNANPGKPHIANMMIQYGYATDVKEAMHKYLNKKKFPNAYTLPETAIRTILKSGGIPVLAHPIYGDGDQLILGEEMDERLIHLKEFGLEGLEAYYSGFSPKLIGQALDFADKFDLLVTAGSDYHGRNKTVPLGDTNLTRVSDATPRLTHFLERVCMC